MSSKTLYEFPELEASFERNEMRNVDIVITESFSTNKVICTS